MLARTLMCLLCLGLASPAWSMTVSPTHIEMMSAGRSNRAQVTIVNTSNAPLPVEAVLMAASYDENGRPKTSKADDDFLIMPPQALIPPGATQNFRIQWLGNPALTQSRSYLLYFSQLPVKTSKSAIAVQVVMSIGVLINVAPAQGAPKLSVVASGISTAGGHRQPRITVHNASNVHGLLRQSTIRLTDGKWSTVLSPAMIEQRIGIGLIQPGHRRQFILPVELPAGVGPLRVNLETASRR
jgi:fimbrial chaperone protein